jgi:hypothetical protein
MAEHQPHDLETDIKANQYILTRVREDQAYAQNLYAALCNTDWQHQDVWTKLKNTTWSCSWRYAGNIIADLREEGDYMDWYCSGMGIWKEKDGTAIAGAELCYVAEGMITHEIRKDLAQIGWQLVDLEPEE